MKINEITEPTYNTKNIIRRNFGLAELQESRTEQMGFSKLLEQKLRATSPLNRYSPDAIYQALFVSPNPTYRKLRESSEIGEFRKMLTNMSSNSHVSFQVGSKLAVLTCFLNTYSFDKSIIVNGFVEPKEVKSIDTEDDNITRITFVDGSIFPEKYEFDKINDFDYQNTLFFKTKQEAEHALTVISLQVPNGYSMSTGMLTESIETTNDQQIIDDFIAWSIQTLRIKTPPKFTFSLDNPKGESKPHTGAFDPGNNTVWVYIGNRNMVDICRTVFHELVHVRQRELGMVEPGKSYPGSPIEALADMLAGKYIKIYGKKHPEIYQ